MTGSECEYHERQGRILFHRQVWGDVIADLSEGAAARVARPDDIGADKARPAVTLAAYIYEALAVATRPIPQDHLGVSKLVENGFEKERERMKQILDQLPAS
ncbi:hypothetical protein [Candidatus Palauibacter sp.]|uniref:hypothetical protein n=1 Tax=Candidatus Palauibacter sp. TaxID=3101350 RepID=UPI003B5A166D